MADLGPLKQNYLALYTMTSISLTVHCFLFVNFSGMSASLTELTSSVLNIIQACTYSWSIYIQSDQSHWVPTIQKDQSLSNFTLLRHIKFMRWTPQAGSSRWPIYCHQITLDWRVWKKVNNPGSFFSLFRDSYQRHDFSWKRRHPLSPLSLDTFYRIKRKGDHCAMNKIVKPKSDLWQLFWKKSFYRAKSTKGRFSFNASCKFLFQFSA